MPTLATSLASAALTLATVATLGAGCGSKAPATTTASHSGGTPTSTDATPWPWEAKLQQGASFPMVNEEGTTLTMTVAAVEATADSRTYTLAWTNNSQGPERLVVAGTKVQVGESPMDPARAVANKSYRNDGTYCFAEDFSNPDGCDDVCDAEICFSAEAGLAEVSLMYAPGYMTFSPQ